MTDYSFHLLSRHQRIDDALRAERRRPWPDVSRIHKLGRLKRIVKDRLIRLVRR